MNGLLGLQHLQKQTETGDHETEPHECKTSADPREKGSFGGEIV